MISLTKEAVFAAKAMLKEKRGYGIRVRGVQGGCSGLYFDLSFDKKKSGDTLIKSHGNLYIFADWHTKNILNALPKKHFQPATIEFVKTHLGPKFMTESSRVRLGLWQHELE